MHFLDRSEKKPEQSRRSSVSFERHLRPAVERRRDSISGCEEEENEDDDRAAGGVGSRDAGDDDSGGGGGGNVVVNRLSTGVSRRRPSLTRINDIVAPHDYTLFAHSAVMLCTALVSLCCDFSWGENGFTPPEKALYSQKNRRETSPLRACLWNASYGSLWKEGYCPSPLLSNRKIAFRRRALSRTGTCCVLGEGGGRLSHAY